LENEQLLLRPKMVCYSHRVSIVTGDSI
jgi:hypothetical protein